LSRPTQWVLLAGEQLLLQQAAQEVGVRHLRLDGSDIDFAMLPEAFVLRVTWGSDMNILCPNKSELDVRDTRGKLASWMMRNHYWAMREWCYKNIKPRIICERFLIDRVWHTPPDYKFFCFGGEPRFVEVVIARFTQYSRDFVDLDWRLLPFNYGSCPSSEKAVARPSNLDEMTEFARRLANDFPFVRVDFYAIDGQTLFGEMTWYPLAGEFRFVPESYDRYWGEVLQLPARKTVKRLLA
jgi:hypothetical protein